MRVRKFQTLGCVGWAVLVVLAACGGTRSARDNTDATLPPVDGAANDLRGDAGATGQSPEAGMLATNRPERRLFTAELLSQLRTPPGFAVSIFAQELENPRMMAVAADGSVYVTSPQASQVVRLADANGDGDAADPGESAVAASKMDSPALAGVHGITFHQGRLYLASIKSVVAATPGATLTGLQTLVMDLPDGGQHPNRTLGVGPDGKLYVSVGSSCNACLEPNSEHATMLRLELTGAATANPPVTSHPLSARPALPMISPRVFAAGLRNTLGFDWHPVTQALWGSDQGSDGLGDGIPPDEINRIDGGKSYGWPYCWGDRKIDPTIEMPSEVLSREAYCTLTEPYVEGYDAHSSPIAFLFYRGSQFPADYQGDAFAVLRGSWNRSVPTGYKVVRVRFEGGVLTPTSAGTRPYDDFLSGFLIENGRAHFGRIAGLAVTADGALLVSDDSNGVIYKISYQQPPAGNVDGGRGGRTF